MKNIKLKNTAKQVEMSFLSPDVLGLEKVPFFGHFISTESYPNYSKTTLIARVDTLSNTIFDIIVDSSVVKTNLLEKYVSYKEEYAFMNEYSMSDLLRTQQLSCHSVLTNDICSEIMFFEVEPLCEGYKSYLFFGFADADNVFVKEKHSEVFYKDLNEDIQSGGKVAHKKGSPLTEIFNNNVFGFGQQLKCHGSAPKTFIDGTQHWMKLINEDDKETQEKIKKVFIDAQYREYLKILNRHFQKIGYPGFWQTKEQSDDHKKLVVSVIQQMQL